MIIISERDLLALQEALYSLSPILSSLLTGRRVRSTPKHCRPKYSWKIDWTGCHNLITHHSRDVDYTSL